MEIEFKITQDDYVSAMKLYSKRTPIITGIYSAIVIVLCLIIVIGTPDLRVSAIGGLFGGSIVIMLMYFVITPLFARRHYQKYKAIQEPMFVQLMDDGVEFSNADGGGLVRWEKILKWRQNDEYVLLYLMPRLYHIIPKTVKNLGFDFTSLTKKLESTVGKES
jgi:YcxB-like protein